MASWGYKRGVIFPLLVTINISVPKLPNLYYKRKGRLGDFAFAFKLLSYCFGFLLVSTNANISNWITALMWSVVIIWFVLRTYWRSIFHNAYQMRIMFIEYKMYFMWMLTFAIILIVTFWQYVTIENDIFQIQNVFYMNPEICEHING